jgi:hypothetical protein
MNFTFALIQLGQISSSTEFAQELNNEDRVRISRTRRAIDLQEQELLQLALLEERQLSA